MASSKNIGDQLVDAVQSAIDSQNFNNLQYAIEHSIGAAAENIGKGLAQASDGMRRMQEQHAWETAQRNQRLRMQALYARCGGLKAAGYSMAGVGGIIAVPMLTASGIAAPLAMMEGWGTFAIVPLAIGAAGAVLAAFGIRKIGLAKRFDTYKTIIGAREFCPVDELAAHTGETPQKVLKNLKTMMAKGLFKQAALDDSETLLITSADAYREYRQAQYDALQRQNHAAQALQAEEARKEGLDPDARGLLERGESYLARIRACNAGIPDPAITAKIDRIERVTRTIFDRAAEQPAVVGDLDKLMSYYLPTTVKLLEAYRDMEAQPVRSENVEASKKEISGALDTLNAAFEKLLDSLFRDMAWDLSTDISVLHTVLAQEGLVDDAFDINAQRRS